MAKTRKINNALIRVLDQSRSIVYLVSDEQTMTYANQSCADWLGLELESMIGTSLVYSTESLSDPMQNNLKGLALPPDLFATGTVVAKEKSQASVQLRITSNNTHKPVAYMATASPIHDHRDMLSGFLVVATQPNELSEAVSTREAIDDPVKLHQALATLREKQRRLFDLRRLVGTSSGSARVRRQVESAIDSRSDVLIFGRLGTGREHVARTIFNHANTNDEDLIPLHCAITDPMQVQSTMKELASQNKKRQHDPAATTSTLLLLEVDKLDARSQQEVLGYLQLPGFSIRTISTATQELFAQESSFDQQLASHLSTLTIELPTVTQRREDLPLLAQAILEFGNDKNVKQFSGFTRQAIELICEYDWPQNLDQLTAEIENAAAQATGNIIQATDFSDRIHHAIQAQRFAAKPEVRIQLDDFLLNIEKQLVERSIAQAKGNKTKAAELLGISRAKLSRRLQQFETPEPENDPALQVDESVFKEEKIDGV
jgi:DNA-binding NtrC family response regulator